MYQLAGLMRNILYPTGKATYVKAFDGPRNRQLEQQKKASAEQLKADQVKIIIFLFRSVYTCKCMSFKLNIIWES